MYIIIMLSKKKQKDKIMLSPKYCSSKISRDFKKLKKEAQILLDSGKIDKDELIKSIRNKRKKLSEKTRLKYHDHVTEKDMIMDIVNTKLIKKNNEVLV